MKKSLKNRLILYVTLIFALWGTAICYISYIQLRNIISGNSEVVFKEKIAGIINQMDISYQKLIQTGMVEVYNKDFQDRFLKTFITTHQKEIDETGSPLILDISGNILTLPDRVNKDLPPQLSLYKENELKEFNYTTPEGVRYWAMATYYRKWQWHIVYILPASVKFKSLRNFLFFLIPAMLLTFIVLTTALYIVFTRNFKPVKTLTKAAEEITRGNIHYQIDVREKYEIGILAHTFKTMQQSIIDKISRLTESNSILSVREKQLESLRNYLTNIIDSMDSLLVCINTDLEVTIWNHAAEEITGYMAEDIRGMNIFDVLPRMRIREDDIHSVLESQKEQIRFTEDFIQDHKTVYVEVTIYALKENSITGAVIRIDDISEKILLERAVTQSEKMVSVGGLAAGMAHEINNPLGGIIQSVDVVLSRLTRDIPKNIQTAEVLKLPFGALKQYMEERQILALLANIHESGCKASKIVKNMLSFARQDSNLKSIEDITKLIDETISLTEVQYNQAKGFDIKKISIVREYPDHVPIIHCEPNKIQQVLFNLIKNAAEVLLKETAHPQIVIRVLKDPQWLIIEVEDNGPGMDEEIKKRIFDPFFTTKDVGQGTGLGLSISYFIITNNHNGQMSVESEPGKGSRFIIRLPLVLHNLSA